MQRLNEIRIRMYGQSKEGEVLTQIGKWDFINLENGEKARVTLSDEGRRNFVESGPSRMTSTPASLCSRSDVLAF